MLRDAQTGNEPPQGIDVPDLILWAIVATVAVTVLTMALTYLNVRRSAADAEAELQEAWAGHQAASRARQADWEARKRLYEQRETARVAGLMEWGSVGPLRSPRIDIFGGTLWSWEAVLTVFGGSLLYTRRAIAVVDFSGSEICRELVRLAEANNIVHDAKLLPADLAELDLFCGLKTDQIVDMLVEAMHGDTKSAGRADRSQLTFILTQLCKSLDGHVTMARICAAVRILMGDQQAESALSPSEVRTIRDQIFTDETKRHLQPDIVRIASQLGPVETLGSRPAQATGAMLTCLVAQAGNGQSAHSDLLKDLIIQWMAQAPGSEMLRAGALIIAGADDVSDQHLERISDLCDRRGIRLVLLFRHLRDSALRALGGGQVAFMRLGNAEEAARAAEYIGRTHSFQLSQLTSTVGGGDTHTTADSAGTSDQRGRSWGPGGSGSNTSTVRSWNRTRSMASSSSWSDAEVHQRTYEYRVEPTVIQELPEYALLLVKREGGRTQIVQAECNPEIVLLPGVSMDPLPHVPPPGPEESMPGPAPRRRS